MTKKSGASVIVIILIVLVLPTRVRICFMESALFKRSWPP